MTNQYASTDNGVLTFIAHQNATRAGITGPYKPQQLQNGIGGTTTDNVIGLSSIASNAPAIALGSGFNSVIVQGAHSTTAAASGAPDSYSINVDPSGTLTLLDNNTGQSETITGATYLIFNDASTTSSASFSSIYFIGGANQSELTGLYNAALGRQPDLAGVEYYAYQQAAGMTFQQIANEFMASPEFQTRFGVNVTDTQFVNVLYQNILGRTPSATELTYYTAALANGEAGSIVNTTNPVAWSRGQELLNFVNSPENQKDISGWVINTANGGYVDSTGLLSAITVVTDASTSGYVNTALINASSLTSGGAAITEGTVSIAPAGAYGVDASLNPAYVSVSGASQTIVLSAIVPKGVGDGTTTIYGDAAGGNTFITHGADTAYMYGTSNEIVSLFEYAAVPAPAIVYGMVDGDEIILNGRGFGKGTIVNLISTPPATPVAGSSLSFASINAINVGAVTGDTAAAMATAANKVYSVADVALEGVYFYGADPSGNMVVYGWFGHDAGAYKSADTLGNGVVSGSEMFGGVVLVGVTASNVHASWFN